MLGAAVDSGLRLFVTEGVAEEVERHLNRCLIYARGQYGTWHGSVPFVYSAYSLSGRPRDKFGSWLENVYGTVRPVEDVIEYLRSGFSIEHRDLLKHSDAAPTPLRAVVQELWNEAHDRRQARRGSDYDHFIAERMVAHDVENSVGVIQLRKRSPGAPLGYREWWLTLDKTAYRLGRVLRDELGPDAPRSPVLSPDYLVHLLRLGPLRTAVNRERRAELPLITELSKYDFVSEDLVRKADAIREESRGLDDRIVQRRVRDSLDLLRARHGPESFAGAKEAEDRVLERLKGLNASITD